MSQPERTRNRRIRAQRSRGISQRELAKAFGVSRWRVRQLLEERGDPLMRRFVTEATERELERLRARKLERIAGDLLVVQLVDRELDMREADRVAGATG